MDNARKTLITITVLTFFYGLYYWGIPSLINIDKRIDFIEKKILKKTGVKLSVGQPHVKMGLLPSIWLMAEDITILNNDDTIAADLKHSAIKIHLLPLLAKKIHIGNFSADSIEANLIYTKDSKIKLGQYSLPKLPESKMVLTRAYFRIGNYRIALNDLKQNKHILLDGSYLNLDEFKNNKRVKLSTFAKLYVDQKASEIMADVDIKLPINQITEDQFKVSGRISNLNLADFSDYARAIPNSKIKALSGVVNMIADTYVKTDKHKNVFAKLTVDNLGIIQEDNARSIYCKDRLDIKMDADTIKNGLNLRNVKVLSNGIDISINGKITKLDAKMPFVDTNISINNSRTESFIPLLPGEENLVYEANLYALKKNPFYGNINGNLNLKGKADTPDINGKILVTYGYLNNPMPYNTPKATIKLDFTGNKMGLDVKVPAPVNQTVFVTGNVNLYNGKTADLLIKSTPEVDLKNAQIVLNPLHEILKFDLGPVPIMDIKGLGNIDLHVTGTREHPHGWGNFNFKNTTASFLDINNMVLKNGSGTLLFEDENTHFYTTSANLNGKPVKVDGTCTLQGNLNFDITSKQQELADLLKIIKTSPMLADIQQLLSPISAAHGKSDITLKISGTVTDVNDVVFNKNIFAKGLIELFSTTVTAQGINLSNINGKINFNNLDTDVDLTSNLENSNLKIDGKLNEKNANIKVVSNKFVLKDGIKLLNLNIPFKDDIGKIHTSFNANYNGSINEINPNGLNIKGKIYASKGQNISLDNASFDVNNSHLKTSTVKGYFKESPYSFNINAYNILSNRQSVNGNFDIRQFNLANLNGLNADIKDLSGKINLRGQIKDNGIYTDTNLNNISFLYVPEKIKINIASGKVQLKKDTLILNKINSMIGEMPIFADGKIYNLDKIPTLNLYVNAKPTQEFADQFFNNKAVYPIKLKGDINCSSVISGTLNAIRNKTQLKLAENASIYYMGATLGSNENSYPVNITVDNIIYPTGVKINNFQYDKLIPSQNNRLFAQNQLNASGDVVFLANNDLKFNNFRIKTQEPTDAKIFNIIFRKPLMKQGIFTSDIIINGKASAPVVLGKLHITSINMPLFDAIINDIDLDFKRDKVYLNSKGSVLTNNLNISAIMKNNPNPPLIFEDIKVHLEDLDLNKITNALRDYDVNSSRTLSSSNAATLPDFSQIQIKNSKISADNIKIKNLQAQDFISHITLNDKMLLNVEDFKFDMAEGIVSGDIKYNLLNNIVNLTMDVKNTNAQIIAETLFDLKGQVYGLITGNFNLYCNGKSHDSCTQTLGGSGKFTVADGRMPKLGSLEYLLKAGNLIKGGITGLSINGIIDLITPYKTGDFDSISGTVHISNGIADDIRIYSDGKDLNMYMKGSYNFTNLIADMQIFGALTKNFSTLFGKISNASLNTLFNTIPGINISEAPSVLTDDIKNIPNVEDASRMFAVEIYGDINGNDYVKSFKWLK